METKTFTITVFSENRVGLLNQITIVFTKRGLNIETLSVSQSAIKGIHKFTITVQTTEDEIEKVVKQIDKRIDVLKSYYNTDEELVHQEIALYKISTEKILEYGSIEAILRKYNIKILEITNDCVVFSKTGHYEETQGLFEELSKDIGVLQFIRSGRVSITRSSTERLSDMLAEIDKQRK
ncbi:MAG: acetolactate synthase small subunit [Paludibacter sp.]|nr:MAG: acetolactate synthase small subunit [Paludibacter sp.]